MAKRDLGDVAVTALTRPGVGPALLAALGVYGVLAVQSLLGTVVYAVTSYSQDVAAYLPLILRSSLVTAFATPLPFAIGVWLAIWQIAPISPQLRMAHVVTRALLAAVIGAVIAGILGFVVAAAINLTQSNPAVVATGGLGDVGRNLGDALRSVLPGTLNVLLDGLVVVPLAALLLWGWLQAHPTKTAPRGALDEV